METSVWGAIVNDEPVYFRAAAEKLLRRTDDFTFYISLTVTEEISDAAPVIRDKIESLISEVNPILLDESEGVELLADEYVMRGLFTEKYRNDAIHLAYASYNVLDFLVTYNFRHLVRSTRKDLIRGINSILGEHSPKIVSAEELSEEYLEE